MLLEIFECRDLLLEMPVKVSDMGSVGYCAAEFIEEKTAFSRFSFCRSCAFHFQKERKAKNQSQRDLAKFSSFEIDSSETGSNLRANFLAPKYITPNS